MERNGLLTVISALLAGFILLLTLKLYLPFFQPIAWAAVIALLLYPLNRALRSLLKGRPGLVAFILCLGFVAFVFFPLLGALTKVTTQSIEIISEVKDQLESGKISLVPDPTEHPRLYALGRTVFKKIEGFQQEIQTSLLTALSWVGQFLLSHGTVIFRNTLKIILQVVFMIVTLFYLFRDGEKFLEGTKQLLPLPPEETENLVKKIKQVLEATLYGSFLTALAQGLLGFIIFLSLGFSSPFLLGLLIAIASFIPILGTAAVWGPAVVYLLLHGSYAKALGLFLYSALLISQIDSLIRPFFISGRTEIHNLFIFFSILGGLKLFGFLGLFLGPILVALSISVLDIYRSRVLGKDYARVARSGDHTIHPGPQDSPQDH